MILVVEDEESVGELVRNALQRYRYRVPVAPTPGEALAIHLVCERLAVSS
ncbi:MAG: hypothetical protein O7F70_04380 [Gemmatimonadetes bacterium]|nr:hypothetical protein [Gemmatimonadota bacterium]